MSVEFLKRNLEVKGFNLEMRLYNDSTAYAQQKCKVGAAREHGLECCDAASTVVNTAAPIFHIKAEIGPRAHTPRVF